MPDAIPDDIACILDPFGNAVHTALSFDLVGEDVLITGAGPDRHHGRRGRPARGRPNVVITDVNAYRLDLAEDGRHARRDPRARGAGQSDGELGMVEGFDVGLEMSGNADGVPGHARRT